MPPSATKTKNKTPNKTTAKSKTKTPTPKASRNTLSELSMNKEDKDTEDPLTDAFGIIDGETTLRFTPETLKQLDKDKRDAKEYIKSNLTESLKYLELVGWSKNGQIPNELYDGLFTSDLKVKKLTLRGRGQWNTCHCPTTDNKCGELIDTIRQENVTNLEHIFIFRTFKISACALLDLISRSPNLKSIRFYGVLLQEEHHEPFQSVRFLSELEAVYWPWCNVKFHKPTLRTIVKRHSLITAFYSSADIACDFLNSDLLPNLKHLSLIMNEKWTCSPGKTRVFKRYNRNINFLRKGQHVEALEVRTFDVNLALSQDEDGDEDTHDVIRRNFETYKLHFWESVADLPNLKFLAIYGAWELEEVSRELSKRGLQIEYFRTNLMPSSILNNLEENKDNTTKFLVLSMSDAAKHLSKLAKLKSLHFTCHDNLSNIDVETAHSMKELSDLIWKLEIKSIFSLEVEELLTNILRRGNQHGRSYRIRMNISLEDPSFASLYAEAVEKFQSVTSLKDSLTEVARQKVRERFGKNTFKTFSIWGIEQAGGGRDKATFDQLRSTWSFYEYLFRPLDMFI